MRAAFRQRTAWTAVALGLTGLGLACMQRGEPALWLADYEALKQHMSLVYANFEWAVQTGRVDPYRLDQETQAALRGTSSQRQARKAVERFVEAFGDPHFRTERWRPHDEEPAAQNHAAEPIALETSAQEACKHMGFRSANLNFRLKLEALDGFQKLPKRPSNPFHAGVLRLDDGRRVGFIRIAQFGPDRYEDLAVRLWQRRREERKEACDEACQWDFWHRVSQSLLDALDERVRDLRNAGIDALAVDITRNGGGTDWAGIAPRLLSAKPLRCPPFALVKHPRETRHLERRLASVDDKLDDPVLAAATRALLEEARQRLRDWIAQATVPCERMQLFDQPDAELECSQLLRRPGCGLADYLAPGQLDDPELAALLFDPLDWQYSEGVWDGPLFVVVDRHTASAAEQFATLLQANEAAIVMGEPTTGAGCGYVNGGFPINLSNVGLRVHLPNCVRYRADGDNELLGVEPDVRVWTGDDKGTERARKLAAALAEHL